MMRSTDFLKAGRQKAGPLFFLTVFMCLSLLNEAFAAQIKVAVDHNPVGIDESFQITFTAHESPDNDPDFSALEQDFEIINQTSSSSASWVNGKASKIIQWTLTVMAKQPGSLVVPSVKFGRDQSRPLAVTVLAQGASARTADGEEDMFLEVEATPKNPYVQSQIIYTFRFYTRVEITQASLNEPELTDAVIEKLTNDTNYETQINGVNYAVTERKYAIFPQKSGMLTIDPLVLTAEVVINHNRTGFNSFFNSQITKTQRVASKPVTLEVKPIPPSFAGRHWLSAEQLILKEQWSGDMSQMKVGEPMTRTLTLEAKGTTTGQLPELNQITAGGPVKTYPDQPVLKEQKNPEGIIALREEKIALIPSSAGTYTLPPIEIPWFNTKTQTLEMARIPETKISALAAPVNRSAQTYVTKEDQTGKNQSLILTQIKETNIWMWISLFLAMGWLGTLAFFLTPRRPAIPAVKPKQDDPLVAESIKVLKKACNENDAATAKNALIEWGRQKHQVSSLGALANRCDARLRDEIVHLNKILYGKETRQWQGKRLYQAFTENKARGELVSHEDSSLEPLYRL
ncbi:MAG: BatD family protein [Gammaproteobacteria bacterium]